MVVQPPTRRPDGEWQGHDMQDSATTSGLSSLTKHWQEEQGGSAADSALGRS